MGDYCVPLKGELVGVIDCPPTPVLRVFQRSLWPWSDQRGGSLRISQRNFWAMMRCCNGERGLFQVSPSLLGSIPLMYVPLTAEDFALGKVSLYLAP